MPSDFYDIRLQTAEEISLLINVSNSNLTCDSNVGVEMHWPVSPSIILSQIVCYKWDNKFICISMGMQLHSYK